MLWLSIFEEDGAFNPFISQIIIQIYTVKSFDLLWITNKTMPNGIMDGWYSIVLEQGIYSGRSKVILLNASSTKFQLNPTYSFWDVENVKRWMEQATNIIDDYCCGLW